jgi:hypothetical protein
MTDTQENESEFTRALDLYRGGRIAFNAIDALEPEPITRGGDVVMEAALPGAIEGMRELEKGLVVAPCVTLPNFRRKVLVTLDEIELDHIELDVLHVVVDAYQVQKEEEEMALFLKRRAEYEAAKIKV